MPKSLYCADYPELQSQFIATVASLKQADPLAPLTVLVTGQLVQLSLSRELARAGTSHANIRFLTLNELAHELASREIASHDLRMLPDLAADVIMESAVRRAAPNIQYFAKLLSRQGFREALWRTLNELRGAGLSFEQLFDAQNRQPVRNNPTLAQKLGDLANIWRTLGEIMNKNKLADPLTRLKLAIKSELAENISSPLIAFGLDTLTALESSLLEKLFENRDVIAFLAFQSDDDYQWAEPVYRWYFEQDFEIDYLDSTAEHSAFLLSAPGESREAEEIVREILYSPLAESLPDRSIAVLVRQSDPYVDLMRETLSRTGAAGYFHQCRSLGSTTSGRALSRLSRLLDGKLRRDRLMDFLLSAPLNRPDWFPPELPAIPVAEWNHFSLLAQIVEGEKNWREQLTKLARTFEREANRDDQDEQLSESHSRRAVVSANALKDFISRLADRLQSVSAAPTLMAMGESLWNLFAELIELDDDAGQISEEFETLSLLDSIGITPDVNTFRQLLARILETPVGREGRFKYQQPAVATLQQAKGVVFDEILIPGLVERRFPQPVSQDPLLLDDERIALSRALNLTEETFGIPLRGSARLHESYLFRVMTNSARNRVVLSYPRLNTEGRESLPSLFLIRALEGITGEAADYEALDRAFRSAPFARRVPINRLHAIKTATSATSLDFDLAKLHQALQTGNGSALSYLKRRTFFARALDSESRFLRREFTVFEGFVENLHLRKELESWCKQNLMPLSPTRMERYARCPFRYLGLHLLELENVEEPQPIAGIEPIERGSLWHRILEHFYRQERESHRLPITPDSLPRLVDCARQIFAQFEREEITGLFMLWELEKRKMFEALAAFFQHELADAQQTGFIPDLFEQKYAFDFELTNGDSVAFGGRIDRIDKSSDGRARVIDYKTGKKDETKSDGSISGGRALQLPIYRLAAEALLDKQFERAEYFFTSDKGGWKRVTYDQEHWKSGRAEFESATTTILNGIRTGKFYPFPDESECSHCEVRDACGQGRLTRKWRVELNQTRRLSQHARS